MARAMRVLPAPGRPVEDDAARRGDAELLVDVRKLQRQLHEFAHRADLRAESADVFERDVHRAVRARARRRTAARFRSRR